VDERKRRGIPEEAEEDLHAGFVVMVKRATKG